MQWDTSNFGCIADEIKPIINNQEVKDLKSVLYDLTNKYKAVETRAKTASKMLFQIQTENKTLQQLLLDSEKKRIFAECGTVRKEEEVMKLERELNDLKERFGIFQSNMDYPGGKESGREVAPDVEPLKVNSRTLYFDALSGNSRRASLDLSEFIEIGQKNQLKVKTQDDASEKLIDGKVSTQNEVYFELEDQAHFSSGDKISIDNTACYKPELVEQMVQFDLELDEMEQECAACEIPPNNAKYDSILKKKDEDLSEMKEKCMELERLFVEVRTLREYSEYQERAVKVKRNSVQEKSCLLQQMQNEIAEIYRMSQQATYLNNQVI